MRYFITSTLFVTFSLFALLGVNFLHHTYEMSHHAHTEPCILELLGSTACSSGVAQVIGQHSLALTQVAFAGMIILFLVILTTPLSNQTELPVRRRRARTQYTPNIKWQTREWLARCTLSPTFA